MEVDARVDGGNGQYQLYYGYTHRPILQSAGGWSGGREARKIYGTRSFGCKRDLCPFQVSGGGGVRLAFSSVATAMARKLTTYVASQSSAWPWRLTLELMVGMGNTNFTMVMPTVQSFRAPLEGHRLGWVGGKELAGREVSRVQPGEPGVHESSRREARVGETHVGETLRNGEDFVTYSWSPDRLTTAAGGPRSDAVREDSEVRDFVRHSG